MRKITAALVLVLILILPVTSYAEQLLNDPSFKEGYAKWTVSYNKGNWSPVNLPGGKKAIRCWFDGGMRQLVPVAPGKAYELKGDAFVPANGDKDNWNCWISLEWYDANKNKMGTAWSATPHTGERGKWITYSSGRQVVPEGVSFASIDLGVYQNNAITAKPIDFANFSFEGIK